MKDLQTRIKEIILNENYDLVESGLHIKHLSTNQKYEGYDILYVCSNENERLLEVFVSNVDDTEQMYVDFRSLSESTQVEIYYEICPLANAIHKKITRATEFPTCNQSLKLSNVDSSKGELGFYVEDNDMICLSVMSPSIENVAISNEYPLFVFNNAQLANILKAVTPVTPKEKPKPTYDVEVVIDVCTKVRMYVKTEGATSRQEVLDKTTKRVNDILKGHFNKEFANDALDGTFFGEYEITIDGIESENVQKGSLEDYFDEC